MSVSVVLKTLCKTLEWAGNRRIRAEARRWHIRISLLASQEHGRKLISTTLYIVVGCVATALKQPKLRRSQCCENSNSLKRFQADS
jgi:hypothetical protein